MANWSSDTFYFGQALPPHTSHPTDRPYEEAIQRIFRMLHLIDDDRVYIVNSIERFGPAVRFVGSGKWGEGDPIPDDVWEKLKTGIVVSMCHDGFGDDTCQTIVINGETVHSGSRSHEDEDPWFEYVGRNADEQHFFKKLWDAIWLKDIARWENIVARSKGKQDERAKRILDNLRKRSNLEHMREVQP